MKIATAGKGGVGKSVVAGTLARLFAQAQNQVLALDADSNPNLALTLGISREQAGTVPGVRPGVTEWRTDEQGKAYVHLLEPLPRLLETYGKEAPDGVRLLVMGEVLEASIGCRCEAHQVARAITGEVFTGADRVILDMEAGLEHLGRGTIEHVDLLLIVVEPYYRALAAAGRIRELAARLGVPRMAVVGNRVRTVREQEAVEQFCAHHGLELLALVPYDEAVVEAEAAGMSPLDYDPVSPAIQEIRQLAIRLM